MAGGHVFIHHVKLTPAYTRTHTHMHLVSLKGRTHCNYRIIYVFWVLASCVQRICKDKTAPGSIFVCCICLNPVWAFFFSPLLVTIMASDLRLRALNSCFLAALPPRNEKQRAALSSAPNNAPLGPHGSLISYLFYIWTFDVRHRSSTRSSVLYRRWKNLQMCNF